MHQKLIPIARPQLGDEEAARVAAVLKTGWVSQGPEVAAFERDFSAYIGAPFACAVSNCTTALHLALVALDIGPGDEVITVSHSFIATANVVRYVGALPVFVDVDPINGNIDPTLIAGMISPATKAILAVHQIGMPCDILAILKIAQQHGLPVIEDAACAVGSEISVAGQWQKIGLPHGVVSCFSFHPRKIMTTGDGGMLTTSDPELDRKFRLLRQHGMSVSDLKRHESSRIVAESYACLGYNYRLTDVQAAIGRVQLQRLPEMINERRMQAERYSVLFERVAGVGLPVETNWARSNWQSYCIRLPQNIDQLTFMQAMLDSGVSTRRGIMCAHREPAYKAEGAEILWRGTSMRNSEYIQDHGILIPLFNGLTADEQEKVVSAIAACLEKIG